MRASGCALVAIVLIVAVGCAAPPPPKIEGHVSSISAKEIQEIIELVHKNEKRGFNIIPIQRIEVRDHNHVVIYCEDDYERHTIFLTREHGNWSFPTLIITG